MFKSASQGYAPAQFILGLMCLERKRTKKDLEQAVYWLGKAADQDYAEARFVLGEIYLYKREATKKDLELAFELMFKSAKQGYALAQFYLGLMYLHGEGVEAQFSVGCLLDTKVGKSRLCSGPISFGLDVFVWRGGNTQLSISPLLDR